MLECQCSLVFDQPVLLEDLESVSIEGSGDTVERFGGCAVKSGCASVQGRDFQNENRRGGRPETGCPPRLFDAPG